MKVLRSLHRVLKNRCGVVESQRNKGEVEQPFKSERTKARLV